MTNREMLESLREAQTKLEAVYENLKEYDTLQAGIDRVTVLDIIRQDIGPVVYNLMNDTEQEELFADAQ